MSKKSDSPLRVCRSTCDWLTNTDLVKDKTHEVHKAHTERGEKVKKLADKMTTCQHSKFFLKFAPM